jgi:exopolyphosphatase/guanosine-5'-triphosphate,3'-diphosphate pyrophosphatase
MRFFRHRERDSEAADEIDVGLEPLGVIDIGSNSVRLVVYEGAVRSPAPLFNEKVLCGLGRQVASEGVLGQEAVARAIEALTRFRAILKVLGVKNVRVIATAAARDAADGADFIARAEAACGCRIEILSGEQEAHYAAQGVLMGFPGADGIAGDLGGGSLELIDIADGELRNAVSLPLGGLRLIDMTGDKLDRAVAIIEEQLDRVPFASLGAGRPFYAIGGSWRSFARVHMETTGYPLRVMHGYTLDPTQVAEFTGDVRRARKLSGLPGADDLPRPRREILPYGGLLLHHVLTRLGASSAVVSVFGVREGLLFSQLSAHERAKDPLLTFAEDYARLRARSLEHARELARWTDTIFADPALAETSEQRRLRHAACLMSDIGWRAHPDYRGEQSLNVLAHASIGGIDHAGRVFLALAVYYRHVGPVETDQVSDRLKALLPKRLQRRARILGAAVRTAHMLSIGMAGVIAETPLSVEADKIVLTLPRQYVSLDGERLRRRLGQLAALLERTAEIRIG